jgi:Pyruvate/2-oxoacid:ferredoxin oxidoreductase delta subunit
VDVARYFLTFTENESCGKCVPCRMGTQHLLRILTDISEGRGTPEQLEKLAKIGQAVKAGSLCGLGQTAPNPVLSTLRYFRDEYVAHIEKHKCPAHVCRQLNVYRIDPEICVQRGHGCGVCRTNCPSTAISGAKNQPHLIDVALCCKCGVCADVCHFDAVLVD